MERKYSKIDSDNYKTLQEFRRNVKDVVKPHHSDEYLFTYLRANNLEVRKAEKMFRVAQHMRTLYQMDKFATDYKHCEVTEKYAFVSFLGHDKEGCPVRYISLGNADLPGFVMSMSTFEIGMFAEYIIECDRVALEEENRRTGKNTRGYNYIFDMAGFTLQQIFVKPVMETGLDLIKIFQDLHPEDLKAVYCVNAPMFFYAIFNIFKPILRLNLLERIHVFPKDSVPEKLLKTIDHEVLPQAIGGSRVDPDGDPMCRSVIKYGGKVPQELYKMNLKYLQENDPGAKTFVIPARSFYDMSTAVEKAGSRLRVEFRSEHYSVGLWLLYKPFPLGFLSGEDLNRLEIKRAGEDDAELISIQARIQSHLAPVNQVIFCERPGIYIWHFDNTFSLIHSKRIIYRTEIYPPTE